MIIDAHTHICNRKIKFRWPLPTSATEYIMYAPVEDLIKRMDEAKVDKAVLFPIAPYISNEEVVEAVKKYPDRLIGCASVIPTGYLAPNDLRYAIEELHLKGLIVHCEWQGFRADDPLVFPVMRMAEELDIPVFMHTHGVRSFDSLYPIIEMLHVCPKLTVIIKHACIADTEKVFILMETWYKKENLYVDLSGAEVIFNLPGRTMEDFKEWIELLYSRMLFGSDWFSPERGISFEFYKNLNISEDKKKAILGGNIVRIMGGIKK